MLIINDCIVKTDYAKFLVRRCDKSHQEQRVMTATEFAILLHSYRVIDHLRYGIGNVHARAFKLENAGESAGKVRHVLDRHGRLVAKFKPVS